MEVCFSVRTSRSWSYPSEHLVKKLMMRKILESAGVYLALATCVSGAGLGIEIQPAADGKFMLARLPEDAEGDKAPN